MKKSKRQKSSDYKEFLFKQLADAEAAAGYLTAALEEGEEAFFLAVRDVAEARGGVTPLAKKTRLNREGLYDILSEKGNPRFSSLSTIIDALGLKLAFAPKDEKRKAA